MTFWYYILAGIVSFQILRRPYLGITIILVFITLQGLIGDWLSNSDLFFAFLGLITVVGYLFRLLNSDSLSPFTFSLTSTLILVFAVFILISNPDAALNRPDRNWFLTYFQLFALVLLVENVITQDKEVKNTMIVFSFGSLFFLWSIVQMLLDDNREGLVEGANIYTRAFTLSVLFTYFFYKNASRHKFWLLILIMLQCLGVVLTQSRTGIVLLFLSILYVFYRDYKFQLKGILAIMLVGVVVYFLVPTDIVLSIEKDFVGESDPRNPYKIDYSSIDSNIRYYLWNIGYDLWQRSNILVGIGIGQFKEDVKFYFPHLTTGVGLHNTYLSILFETGIIGFAIFMGFIIRALVLYVRASKQEKGIGLATIWLMGFFTLLIGGLTKHDHYDKILFIVIGMSSFFARRMKEVNEKN